MRDHSLVLTRLVNTPLFMEEGKATIITENISIRLALGQALDVGVASPTNKTIPETSNKIGIIKVFDSLVSKGGAGESGFTSYEGIKNQIDSLVTSGVKKIGFYIDSPGGEALGMEGIANAISSLPNKGIQTFAFTDGMATSAAYAIASATQKIYSAVTAKTGSIGTILTLMDVTKRDEQQGIKYTIIRSKDEKAMYNPHEVVSNEVAAKAKAEMLLLDTAFNELVNRNRPKLSIEKIISLKGNAFYGEEALSLGLVDKLVGEFDEVLSLEGVSTNKIGKNRMNEEELLRQNVQLQAEVARLSNELAAAKSTAKLEEKTRVLAILQAGATLKTPIEKISTSIEKDRSPDIALELFESYAEGQAEKSQINVAPATATLKTGVKANWDVNKALLAAVEELEKETDLTTRLL